MKEFKYVVQDELGLHARPAGLLAKEFEDKKFRLALRVTFNQSPRSYSLKEYITKEDFGKLFQANIRNEKLKDLRFYCNDILAKAQEIIDKLEVFSFESFKAAIVSAVSPD